MRYDNLRAFEKHLQASSALQVGTASIDSVQRSTDKSMKAALSPFYLLVGERAECREGLSLLYRFLSPSSKTLARTVLEGESVTEKSLEEALFTPSLFVSSRLVLIENIEKLKKGSQELLESFLAKPSRNLTVIGVAESYSKNSSFYKEAEKIGVVLDIPVLKPWEKEKYLVEWLQREAQKERKSMPLPACRLLVNRVGGDLALLTAEWEKILCYCLDKPEISQNDIEAICAYRHPDTLWQLGEAIFSRNSRDAYRIARELLASGEVLIPLLRQLRVQFQTNYQVAQLMEAGTGAVEAAFPYMKGMILTRNLKQAKEYNREASRKGLLAIDECEWQAKNSAGSESLLLELLLARLLVV